MSSNIYTPLRNTGDSSLTAPTPQNTPLSHAPISSGLVRPGVSDIPEDDNEEAAEANEINAVLKSAAARTALEGIVQQRLASLIGKSSGYIESLPVEVKRSIAALHAVQGKQEQIVKEFKRELWELEKKHFERTKPLYERRANIVSGSAAPSREELEAGEEQFRKDDEVHEPLPKLDGNPESALIPGFWLTVLRNHPGVQSLLNERDLDALKQLKDVQLSYLSGNVPLTSDGDKKEDNQDNQFGYKISFFFSPNEFFENEVLEKTYLFKSEIDWAGDYQYDRAIGTEIRWKSEDKDLTKDIQTKKQRSKSSNRTRTVKRAVDVESFFKFFNPPKPPSDEAIENKELSDDDLSELEADLMIHYQLGDDFKDRIIPRAVDYFTGKALEWEEDDWEEDETEDETEDEDEDEDETD